MKMMERVARVTLRYHSAARVERLYRPTPLSILLLIVTICWCNLYVYRCLYMPLIVAGYAAACVHMLRCVVC